ncbi:ABC transporter substrate-binding protein [Corynebacterium liangguodongii]|uniref:Iron siderophore-binding protein n=1 Tax=Corynebacterium liangguodongii TaxID=2079535 RepID=A0A2S0WF80_9CORY|nr:ABC transporter substrate-binding protein [Corynebacterium liangguodongii]AWB84431.1 iron siderophore-binding protein [Corynebacterium liangguodongii]PWB99921.1 iron siderophore-binding protein [Corynebacterium liangguodongii]
MTFSLQNSALNRLRAIALLLAALLGAATVTACSTTDGAPAPDAAAGKDDAPRIVALDWRYEEILEAIGVQPVGIVEIGKSSAPATLKGKLDGITSVGQAKQPNLEVIQSLEPDLILASPTRHEAIMGQLGEIARTESYSDATYTDVLDAMDSIAEIVGGDAPAKAKDVRSRIEDKIDTAKQAVAPGTRAALVGWSDDLLYTWIEQSFAGSLLTAAGYDYGYTGDKSAIESKTDVAELTGDKLPEMNLDVMYLYNDIEGFKASPYAGVVDNIVEVEQDTWSRSRGPLAAEAMLDQIIETAKH